MPESIKRVIIEHVQPQIDSGRFAARRSLGERVRVSAAIFADGHDTLSARLLYRGPNETRWHARPMTLTGNDRWEAEFTVTEMGTYYYTLRAWIDRFATWSAKLAKKAAAGQAVGVELLEGADLLSAGADRVAENEAALLTRLARLLRAHDGSDEDRVKAVQESDAAAVMADLEDTSSLLVYDKVLRLSVERTRARFSAWYELFPRSTAPEPGGHGTLRDCIARLPYIAGMGFDILYLPPIHPIGHTHRKGPNNQPVATEGDPGSPWAIGAAEQGGHTAIHPRLGTFEDFRELMSETRRHGLEIALDLAFQCSPDHPWVREHPEWFHRRPDGSIQYAENPPKKYQDIYPLDFESPQADSLQLELLEVVRFWMRQGVRIIRVDNPHTKPHSFW